MKKFKKNYEIRETGLDKIKIPKQIKFTSGLDDILFDIESSIEQNEIKKKISKTNDAIARYPFYKLKGMSEEGETFNAEIHPHLSTEWIPIISPTLKPKIEFALDSYLERERGLNGKLTQLHITKGEGIFNPHKQEINIIYKKEGGTPGTKCHGKLKFIYDSS